MPVGVGVYRQDSMAPCSSTAARNADPKNNTGFIMLSLSKPYLHDRTTVRVNTQKAMQPLVALVRWMRHAIRESARSTNLAA